MKLKDIKQAIHNSYPVGAAADMLAKSYPIEKHIKLLALSARSFKLPFIPTQAPTTELRCSDKRQAHTRNRNILRPNNPNK